jgi:hypothetical protein
LTDCDKLLILEPEYGRVDLCFITHTSSFFSGQNLSSSETIQTERLSGEYLNSIDFQPNAGGTIDPILMVGRISSPGSRGVADLWGVPAPILLKSWRVND